MGILIWSPKVFLPAVLMDSKIVLMGEGPNEQSHAAIGRLFV